VCQPKIYRGLDVLHLEKFARALRLHWPWLEWKDYNKIWVGSGNICSEGDMDYFYTTTIDIRLYFGMLLGLTVEFPKILLPNFLSVARERLGPLQKPFMRMLGSGK
jgi:hypothetical protein